MKMPETVNFNDNLPLSFPGGEIAVVPEDRHFFEQIWASVAHWSRPKAC
jgi:hypothetical protein